jgi:5-methylcytosine-specific restriction protein A
MPKRPPVHRAVPARTKVHHAAPPRYGQGRGGRPWRRKRDAVLKRDGHLCRQCRREGALTLASQVDHVVPVAEGGTDDETNLEAICDLHHLAKTQAEARRGRRP